MVCPKSSVANDVANLRKKVNQYFNETNQNIDEAVAVKRQKHNVGQIDLALPGLPPRCNDKPIVTPFNNLREFMEFMTSTLPAGDIYIFGGMLRDFALFGKSGFNSDIDIVVDGSWDVAYPTLLKLGAKRNKFGGLRFEHGKIPIDIWLAKDTWAVRNGYVKYDGILSLLETTFINWDSILMNWRTKSFFYRKDYFEDINARYMDVVLEYNPNPLGMFVRILRYIILKEAQRVSFAVSKYLSKSANIYSYDAVRSAELSSYGECCVHQKIYEAFKQCSLSINPADTEQGIWVGAIRNPTKCLINE